jgi:NAD(P)-dependent dehydrogenase (short-subunit alcohol dehydrogenase family)
MIATAFGMIGGKAASGVREGHSMQLRDRTAIVTGGAQGIGAAICRRFAAEGAAVLVVDQKAEAGAAVAAEIVAAGGRALFTRCDVANAEELARLVPAAVEAFGDLSLCVNCAGVAGVVDFLSLDRGEFERVLAINLTAPFQLGQASARRMVAQGHGGAIVNVSSVSAMLANPGQTAYCASKAGLGGLTREMAVSLAPFGIRVNALAPGPTLTGMATQHPQYLAPILARTPLGRFASPEEMAAAALFLASDGASFMTGETMVVDGGRCALNYTMPARAAG